MHWRPWTTGSVTLAASWVLGASALVIPDSELAAQACAPEPARAQTFLPALADTGRIYRAGESPDGSELWFFRKVGANPRAQDYRIFVSRRQGTDWGVPQQARLGAQASDLYPALTPDGGILVFASYRPIPGDTARPNATIWQSRRTSDGWSEPVSAPGFPCPATTTRG